MLIELNSAGKETQPVASAVPQTQLSKAQRKKNRRRNAAATNGINSSKQGEHQQEDDAGLIATIEDLWRLGHTNTFSAFVDSTDLDENFVVGCAFVPMVSIFNHSCDPECCWMWNGRKIVVHLIKDVTEGTGNLPPIRLMTK
jgi:hypothetical protein